MATNQLPKLILATISITALFFYSSSQIAQGNNEDEQESYVEKTLMITDTSASAAEAPACVAELPTVEWLGEGPGTYLLPDDYEVFVVKNRPRFWFYTDVGEKDENGQQTVTVNDEQSRVYACSGSCDFERYLTEPMELGALQKNQRVEMITIDDDGLEQENDQRINWWAADDPSNAVERVEDQQMVKTLSFDVPFDATWYFMVNDSIGVVLKCIDEPPTPSATPTETTVPTQTPTVTNTATERATQTPVDTATAEPTLTPKPTMTPAPTETPAPTATVVPSATATNTALPTATITEIPTATETAIATATEPSVATATGTATATSTLTSTATPSATANVPVLPDGGTSTATPVIVPTFDITGTTAINLVSLQAEPHFMGIQLTWETSAEIGTRGFQILRSNDGIRANAVVITDMIITALGGSSYGGSYAYIDLNVTPGATYTYWLDEVFYSGGTQEAGFTEGWAATMRIDLPIIMQ